MTVTCTFGGGVADELMKICKW